MISIVILTYNRQEVLKENLAKISRQTYKDKEIIVVDNGNSEDTRSILLKHYQDVFYLPMQSNVACAGRNAGIKYAKGDIIVTLDDDVTFTKDNNLETIAGFFQEREEVDVLNFKIVFEDNHQIIPFNWYHPRDYSRYGDTEFETDYIGEGAVAFRKSVFERSGYYPEEFFLAHEGPDLAYRIIDSGYSIWYSPQIAVTHKVDKRHRPGWRNSYYDTRNQIWLGIRNYPVPVLIRHLSYRLITTFLFCLFRGHIVWYFRAVRDAIVGLPAQFNYRRPVSAETMKKLREIRRYNLGLWGKTISFAEKIRLVKDFYN